MSGWYRSLTSLTQLTHSLTHSLVRSPAVYFQVVSLSPSLPGHAAVFDPTPGRARVLLVDTNEGTVSEVALPMLSPNGADNDRGGDRGGGGVLGRAPPGQQAGWRMKRDLGAGGELVFFQPLGARIVAVDLLSRSASTLDLPDGTVVTDVHFPS